MRIPKIVTAITLALGLAGLAAQAGPAAAAAPADLRAASGLYGSADPTYDGVYRQSLALLGLAAAGSAAPSAAVGWLVSQQCASGAFQAYRADVATPCSTPDPQAFTGPDSNSTALGALGLNASGRRTEATRAVRALIAAQNPDGGWGYTLGGPSDANSTGLALAAVRGLPKSGPARSSLARGSRFLASLQLPCTAPADARYALPYQSGQPANALASVQGLLGLAGSLPVPPTTLTGLGGTACDDPAVQRLAWHVDRLLRVNRGAIPSALDSGKADWNATATGVIALASAGAGRRGVAAGIAALGRNATAYTGSGATASPAAVGTLIQAAVATGKDPRRFGPTRQDLLRLLAGTLTR
ncbi:MAG: prenyltransferase/squalene oxidase repeat-containing protein [Candidatus Nanopelagicales bacterium]